MNSIFLGRESGLARGFGDFKYVEEDQSRKGAARRITTQAMRWLGARRDRRIFLFIHYYDVHSDYRSRLRYERMFAPQAGRFTRRRDCKAVTAAKRQQPVKPTRSGLWLSARYPFSRQKSSMRSRSV